MNKQIDSNAIKELSDIIFKSLMSCIDPEKTLLVAGAAARVSDELAEDITNAGYCKGGKDEEVAVVSEDLPPKDQEKERSIDEKIAKACKETAREILQKIIDFMEAWTNDQYLPNEIVENIEALEKNIKIGIKEEFGVEVK